ncbi:MAG: response regulator [Flammeovirgaceae bacterium]
MKNQTTTISKTWTVVHADDHELTRLGLVAFINRLPHFQLVGDAADGREAWRLIRTQKPDIALLDVDMPHLSGIEIARLVMKEQLSTQIVLLSAFLNKEVFQEGVLLGINAFIPKKMAVQEIEACLKALRMGKRYLSKVCFEGLKNQSDQVDAYQQNQPIFSLLTPKELAVLTLIAQHLPTQKIAQELNNSERTIDTHRYNISRKLNLSGNNSLLSFALKHRTQIFNFANKSS